MRVCDPYFSVIFAPWSLLPHTTEHAGDAERPGAVSRLLDVAACRAWPARAPTAPGLPTSLHALFACAPCLSALAVWRTLFCAACWLGRVNHVGAFAQFLGFRLCFLPCSAHQALVLLKKEVDLCRLQVG